MHPHHAVSKPRLSFNISQCAAHVLCPGISSQAHVTAQFRSLRMLFQDIDFQVHGAGLVGEALVIQVSVLVCLFVG